ncbi:MAG: hypothetical protein GWN58_66610, partial [Anaerolineae bacterium]|nr:hypothetical protein [Anaerolineae bacterium]
GDRLEGPLPDNLEFVQVPAYGEGIWPWDEWFGNGLRSILENVGQDPVVALFLPDHWLCGKVNKRKVQGLEAYVLRFPTLRANLTAGTCLDHHGEILRSWYGMEIVSVPPTDPHCGFFGGITFAPALWDRERLLRILEPGWSLWAAEKVGTEKFARMGLYPEVRSIGTRPAILKRAHGMYHEYPRTVRLEGLDEEDREIVLRHLPAGWKVVG